MASMTCCEKFSDMVGIGCCIDEDEFKKKPLAEITQNKDRHCTDVPCLLALIIVIFFEFYLIVYASGKGANPDYLLHGWDYTGSLCDSSNANGKYNAWPDLMTSYKVRVCVSDCSQTTKAGNDSRIITHYASDAFLGAWCLPNSESLKNLTDSKYNFDSVSETYERALSDLATTKWLILASAFIAIVFSFLYLKIVSCVARIVIWLTIIVLFAGGFLLSYCLIEDGQSNMKEEETEDTGKVEFGIGIGVAVFLCLLLLSLLWCRKRIDLAIEMLHEAAHAIRDMKTTVLFPVIYSFVGIGYMAFWIVIALYIYSVKKEVTDNAMPSTQLITALKSDYYDYYEFDTDLKNTLLWHIVCLWYIMQVIIYFGFMVLAGVISDWYFSDWDMAREKKIRGDGRAELSHAPLCETIWRIIRFHLGSLAFGSAVITIVRVIRATVTYIEKKTKDAQNPVAKCLFACVKCCLKCMECILDKISKEGFIFTTIYGTGFCYSSFQVIKLLWSNIGRATVVSAVSRFMEIFGRLGLACSVTGVCLFYLNYDTSLSENVSSVVYPCVVIFILSYVIGSLFMMVLEVGVDAIFLCFLVDEIVHGTPRFASNKLLDMASLHYQQDFDTNVETNSQNKGANAGDTHSTHGKTHLRV